MGNNLITNAAMVVEYIRNKFGIEYTPKGMVSQTKEVIVREDSTINTESDIKLFKQI